MRLTLIIALAVCFLAIFSVSVMAGDYHVGSGLKCYQCHVMHASKSHLYTDDSHDHSGGDGAVQSYDKLLIAPDVNAVCLECHDNGAKRDVYGVQDDAALNRIAGWFGGDTSTPYAAPMISAHGHDLGNGSQTPPGGSVGVDMNCASCHDSHGNAYYRNIKPVNGEGITYATGTNDTTKDVFQLVSRGYHVSNISYNKPNDTGHNYERFCVSCHTDVHSEGGGGEWLKHPTFGHSVNYTEGTLSPLKTLGGTPVAGGSGALVAGDVTCVTCHKPHGSSRPFGLIYDNRTTAELEDLGGASANIRLTCKHCHDKGLTATE